MIQVSELRGYKSLRALNVFHTLMLGLKMLPEYMGEQYEEFFERIEAMPSADQEKLIRQAAVFVELQEDEVAACLSFCKDPNGVPFDSSNLRGLAPDQIHEMIVAVCVELAKIKVSFISDAQKKN